MLINLQNQAKNQPPNQPRQLPTEHSFGLDFRTRLTAFIRRQRTRRGIAGSTPIYLTERDEIASGGTAFIYRLKYSNGLCEVEKSISPRFQGRQDFEDLWAREFEILRSLTHPLIVRAFQLKDKPSVVGGSTRVLVLEHIEGVNLSQLLNFIAELPADSRVQWATEILRQLVSILSYLGHCKVIHGDLAPENLILQRNGLIKLVDFGVARRESDSQHDFQVAGRAHYRAPELKKSGLTSKEGDVYAVGKIFEIILGEELAAAPQFSKTLATLIEKRELPHLEYDQGWFRGVNTMPPESLLSQPAVIRAKTKLIKAKPRISRKAMVHSFTLAMACTFLTSFLPQSGTLTINTLPSSMIMVQGANTPLTTPVRGLSLPSGQQRLHFIVPSQQNRRVIREIVIQPNEHLKLFEDFRKN